RVWDAKTEALIATLEGHTSDRQLAQLRAAFSPDGTRIVTSSWGDNTARVWSAATGAQLLLLKGHSHRVKAAAYSRDGRQIATASDDRTARLWDAVSGAELLILKGHT